MYKVEYSPSFTKYLKKIKDNQLKNKLKEGIKMISENPYLGKQKKGILKGRWCYDIYYNKTNYELAYEIHEYKGKLILVLLAGSRENFYDQLSRLVSK